MEDYHHLGDYLARLSAVAAQGDNINSVLLLQPTTTGFFYQNDRDKDALTSVGRSFQDTHLLLERGNVEYDIGSEYLMANWGGVNGKSLKVGQRSYHTVVITPQTENLNHRTFELLKQFSQAGGNVIYTGELPGLVDGTRNDELKAGSALTSLWKRMQPAEVVLALQSSDASNFQLEWDAEKNGKLFHHRRTLADGELVLLVNTSIEQPARAKWSSSARVAETWDLQNGSVAPAKFITSGGRIAAKLNCHRVGAWYWRCGMRAPLSPQNP